MRLNRRYLHLKRYRQIANTLARHGFGYLVGQLGLGELLHRGSLAGAPAQFSRGEHLRRALEELGVTFVKLGQILSTRPDLLPRDVVDALARLQDDVPPFPYEQVRRTVEEELGQPLERLFRFFAPEPLAAASIGQAHRAVLASGQEVVVKVQRPGVRQQVEVDLEILFDVARLADRHTPWGKVYSFTEMAEEFARTLREELDYAGEGRNADRLRRNFQQVNAVRVPEVFWDYTTGRVLVMEYVAGVKLSQLAELDRLGYDRKEIAANLARAVFQQVLLDGFFHGDPHPGNILVLPGNRIAFLDFGMMGRLSAERQEQFIRLVLGLARRNSKELVRTILDMGIVGAEVDLAGLRRDVDRLRDRYYDVPFSELQLGPAVNEILEVAFRHKIRLPGEFTLLAKALLTLEGVARDLDPDLNIVTLAEPLARELLKRRWHPAALAGRLREEAGDLFSILWTLPGRLDLLLERAATGQFTLRLEHDLRELGRNVQQVANRLSFALVLLSFSIIMAGLVVGSALGTAPGTYIFRLPILEAGFVVATVMFGWLIYSIFRSGRF